jgi:hypothetical protein
MSPGLPALCIEKHGFRRVEGPGEAVLPLRLVLLLEDTNLDAVRAEFEQFSRPEQRRQRVLRYRCGGDSA